MYKLSLTMSTIDQKLDQIIEDIELIKNHLKIVPDKDSEITDIKSSINQYKIFAIDELEIKHKNT